MPVAIVGAGRLGTALLGALREAGVPVTGPHGRGFDGAGAGVVLLCVPDDAIAAAADAVTAPGVVLGHCSGASRLDVLGEHEGFSLHPLMTVTRDGADFRGVTAAVAGRTPRALAAATALAGALGLRAVQVAESDRAAYHAAAAIASNFLITLQDAAAELMATAGLDREVLLPLARAALENWGRSGPAALTGPVARGDTRRSIASGNRRRTDTGPAWPVRCAGDGHRTARRPRTGSRAPRCAPAPRGRHVSSADSAGPIPTTLAHRSPASP